SPRLPARPERRSCSALPRPGANLLLLVLATDTFLVYGGRGDKDKSDAHCRLHVVMAARRCERFRRHAAALLGALPQSRASQRRTCAGLGLRRLWPARAGKASPSVHTCARDESLRHSRGFIAER